MKYHIANTSDPSDTYTIEADHPLEAFQVVLDQLGWELFDGPGQDEPEPEA